ncbi:MAG: hypothetical protein IT470_03760 [Pseudomonadales bacterium]|nr:hypothetical protein [Pseudomonadales bacterium]
MATTIEKSSVVDCRKGRDLHISAASGLVIVGSFLHAVADDERYLSTYRLDDLQYLQQTILQDGQLPAEKAKRKKLKPDFESLAAVPSMANCSYGALLAIGSGSTVNRQRAVLLALDADGNVGSHVRELDFSKLYAALSLEDCNIEGAVVCGEDLILLQRANAGHEQNALVRVPLLQCLSPAEMFTPVVTHCALPTVQSVPLGFTDGILLNNGNILFSAVAENTSDSYNDGTCLGAAIGEITQQGVLVRYALLAQPFKIEGIACGAEGELYAVTDADDPGIPAQLLCIHGW